MSDISLGASQVVAFLSNMLDLTKTKRKELEDISSNLFKIRLQNSTNLLIAVANTAGNSTANDLFIDRLIILLRETYDQYPNADIMADLILDAIELYWIAVGKHFQGKESLFDTALVKSLSDLSFQKKPQFLMYDSYMKNKKHNDSNVVRYQDE